MSAAPQKPRGSYGSNVLWAHLLRKDTSLMPQPSLSSNSIGPITPTDKTGTSMRILLHDTQATLEKFSARVDKLTSGVEETKREMVTMKTLFGEEHDKVVEHTVSLVNRCQTTLQSSIGAPAQAVKVQEILDDLSSKGAKLESLDKKLELLQMVRSYPLLASLVIGGRI
ncbi:hypothetical protein GLOTRDRAFT_40518 [Gloeophyllum trabeum ATCC 11539]|uniref:Uncharacterized protein n=1 Tax=Gloeophyllum trabeum (strain ATCC 11539 / FP-39264 / Madison 617) TaxID=670483 RepID=S7RU31_GLOTA|nr:uncharacterized protein GLOTRDRAFT_40518 [Gloeophyllum trabeum ATCC 11539]EPQ56679.1 hypothetical protein GLOTRDRAFT_40518 [Gloeophyllum trabeum ATCC 11539]